MSDSNGFWIRNLRESDLSALLEIERCCFPDPWPAMWFREPICMRDFCIGALNGNQLIGYLFACREEESLHLANLAVDPDHRKQGVATALVEQIIRTAVNEKFEDIYLEVRRGNEDAIRLYERYGFKVTGVEEKYYLGQEDALKMRVKINGLV